MSIVVITSLSIGPSTALVCTCMPGVIDDQVHFREPGLTHKEDLGIGLAHCAAGGVTSFLEMPNTKPPAITHARVCGQSSSSRPTSRVVNYGFYIGATPDNVDELGHS